MGLFDRFRKKAVISDSGSFNGGMFSFVQSFLGLSRSGEKYLREYKNWVFACVQARAQDFADIKLRLVNDDDEEVFEHEVLDVLWKANPYMTLRELLETTRAFQDLEGNAFWWLARDKAGKNIVEIYPLRPDRVQIVVDDTDNLKIKGYIYQRQDGKEVPFDVSEVLHFKNFNPLGQHPYPHRGMGIVQAAIWSIDTDNEARQWNYSFFKNSARPDGFLVKEGVGAVSESEFRRLKEQWNSEYRGSKNAYKVGILSGGLRWQEVGKTHNDMEFAEQRRFSRDEILAMFRVPKTIIGIVEDVNRASADASNYIFSLRTIKPLMQSFVDYLNEFFLPLFNNTEGLRFEFDSPVPEDRLTLLQEYSFGVNKWLTVNDIRRREGLSLTKEGDKIFGTMGMIPIDEVAPEKMKAQKPRFKKNKQNKDIAENVVDKFIKTKYAISESHEKIKKAFPVEKYIEIWKKDVEIRTSGLVRRLRDYFDDQEKEVMKNLRSELKGLTKDEYRIKGVDDFLFDNDDAVKGGISLITPFIRKFIEETGGQIARILGGNSIDMSNPDVVRFIEKRAEYFAEQINETTSKELMETLEEGLENGEDFNELSERVSQVYGKARDYRSDMIARTEVAASSNFGASQTYLQNGITEHQWVVVNPEDEDCQKNAGQIVKIGDSFNSGNSEPPVHPNCVCTTIPVFE